MKVFNALPAWIWLLICAGLFSGWVVTVHQLQEEQKAHLVTQVSHVQALATAEALRADTEALFRQKEKELNRAQESHAQEIVALRQELDTARSAGRVVAERLRHAASEAAERAGEVLADPGSAELRQTAQATVRMLAELREQADHHAGVLAQFATDAHLAGLACERRYDEAHNSLSVPVP